VAPCVSVLRWRFASASIPPPWEGEFQDAIPAHGPDLLLVDGGRQGEAPVKAAVGSLDPKIALFLDVFGETPLPLEREGVVVNLDLDILSHDPRQIRLDHDRVQRLVDIYRRRPGSGRRPSSPRERESVCSNSLFIRS